MNVASLNQPGVYSKKRCLYLMNAATSLHLEREKCKLWLIIAVNYVFSLDNLSLWQQVDGYS